MFSNGREFMEYLYTNYGIVEGYRMAQEYLTISREIINNTDPEEIRFCEELETEMRKLDMI